MKLKLLALAAAWRDKAARVQNEYGQLSKVQTDLAVATLETCAKDLEYLAENNTFKDE